jgi:hypothetical protein
MRDLWDAFRDKMFWLFFAMSAAGYFDVSAFVIVPATILLTLCSVATDPHYVRQFIALGKLHLLVRVWVSVLARDLCLISLCFGMGHVTRWLWTPLP